MLNGIIFAYSILPIAISTGPSFRDWNQRQATSLIIYLIYEKISMIISIQNLSIRLYRSDLERACKTVSRLEQPKTSDRYLIRGAQTTVYNKISFINSNHECNRSKDVIIYQNKPFSRFLGVALPLKFLTTHEHLQNLENSLL